MNRLKIFLSLGWKTRCMLLEAFLFLGWARILKKLPFAKVAPTLGVKMQETTFDPDPENVKTIKQVAEVIQLMKAYTFWESQCMVQAIAAMKMLTRRKIACTLYLGTAKDNKGNLIAHAWLRSGPLYISGAEVMGRFTVVSTFAKEPRIKRLRGENYG